MSDRTFIAQWARAVISNVLQVGAFVMLYFMAVELVAYYQPAAAWLRNAPTFVAIVGFGGFVVRAWETNSTLKRIDKRTADAENT